jgi:uncharacterized glyoxalase superfamily protein PhnB
MKPPPQGWPRISSAVFYEDPAKAIDWLCRVFGFEVRLKVEGEGGRIEHSELTFDGGLVMVGTAGGTGSRPGRDFCASPRALGANTQSLCGGRDDRGRAANARLWLGVLGGSHLSRRGPRRPPLVVHAAGPGPESGLVPRPDLRSGMWKGVRLAGRGSSRARSA